MSQRVVEAVAAERGVEHSELEPLYYSIDPGCLEDLYAPGGAAARVSPDLAFTYEGHRVTVSSDGSIEVASLEEGEAEADPLASGVGRGA